MFATGQTPPHLSYDRYGFQINGKRRFLLAGTIAYFRMARADWRDRLTRLRDSGFNMVDVYVPWNLHEPTEGEFDFATGNRDLAAYLTLCHELGLFVYFRPGPYICNEWDGGGLPTWLYTKPDVQLRQNSAPYLAFVQRYLQKIDQIVRPFLFTNNGPILLYALENELDFFPCNDPHGYISAIRDFVREDGIDVPLTACIGNRTPVQAATGLVDGVIPSPNIYENTFAEREAARARSVLHASHFASGAPMNDLPPFVTEMGRDENSLKRILSTGYRGLGPFNFAGGANFGYSHAVNNWKNLSYLATSIDFEGMIGFDGTLLPAFFGARRLAGLIHAFEDEILYTEPMTSRNGGPICDNPNLGPTAEAGGARSIYSLVGAHGSEERAFVFLYNSTDAAQETKVAVRDQTFPRYSTLSVTPNYTHVVLANLPLDRHGAPATLRYSTAELVMLTQDGDTVQLLVYGESGAQGELSLTSTQQIRWQERTPTIQFVPEPNGVTLVCHFGERTETVLQIGEESVHLITMDREMAGRNGLADQTRHVTTVDLLEAPRSETPQAGPHSFPANTGSTARAMETFGVYHSAGWYTFTFDAHASTPPSEIVLPHAGDILTAFLDDHYIGTFVGDGGPLTIPLSTDLSAGPHLLRFRTEIWGHSNFHDKKWPAAILGSLRGIQGTALANGDPISGSWSFAPERLAFPSRLSEAPSQTGPIITTGGKSKWLTFDLSLYSKSSLGAVLTLQGTDVFGEIRLGDMVVGRLLFGPTLPVAMVGGPPDRFFLPNEFLQASNHLAILIHGISDQSTITVAKIDFFC